MRPRTIVTPVFIVATLLGLAQPLFAQDVTESTQPAAEQATPLTAEQRLEALDQRTRIIERRYELDKEDAAEKAKTRASVDAGPEGFSIKSADKSSTLRFRLLLQVGGQFFLNDVENKAVNNFFLQSVRPTLEGVVANGVGYRFTSDFGFGKVVLQDAYLDVRYWKFLSLQMGKFKPPIGLERLQSDSGVLFVARALPSLLIPARDIGAQLHGNIADGSLQYAVGVFNGGPDGSNLEGDLQDHKDVAARLFVQPFKTTNVQFIEGLGLGVGGSRGWGQGSLYAKGKFAAAPGLASYKTPGQQSAFSYLNDNKSYAGTVFANGKRARVSPQAYYYLGPVGILCEYVISSQEVQKGTRKAEIGNRAYQVAGSVVLTGENASYYGVAPKQPLNPANGDYGALDVAARFHRLILDKEAFVPYAAKLTRAFADLNRSPRGVKAWTVGLNWYVTKQYRMTADFERATFEGGAKNKNRDGESTAFVRFQVSL